MKLTTTFEDIKGPLLLCMKDGMCIYGDWPESYPLCPIYNRHSIYTSSAAGLISLLRALSDNWVGYTSTAAEFAYECTLCGVCDMCELIPVPSPHTSPTELIRFLRSQLVKQGLIPERLIELYKQVKEHGDYLGETVNLPEKIRDDSATSVFFADCIHSKGQRQIYDSAVRLLEKIGGSMAIFGHGGCCGSTLYDVGFWDELNKLVTQRAKEVKSLKGKEIIFVNPHCQEFMLKRFRDFAPEAPKITGKHFSEFLSDAFKDGKLKARQGKHIKVSYHDPCYLGRALGIYEAPREVLSFLGGVELIEMKRNRGNAYCCGSGGGGKGEAFPVFSTWVAKERFDEFKETGADLLITCCPYCKEAFLRVLPKNAMGKVKDLIEFVDERTS